MDFTDKRITASFRVAAFILTYLVLTILIGIFDRFLPPKAVMVVLPFLSVAMPLGLVVVFRALVDREPLRTLGIESTPAWGYEFLTGFAVAAFLVAAIFIGGSSLGWITFRSHFTGGMLNITFAAVFAFLLVSNAAVAFSEELMFRGYVFFNAKAGWGVPAAVGVSSVLFSLGHIFNPGFNWLVAVNLALAGVLLAYATYVTGNIWWAAGFHAAWNFFQGSIFGFSVSGTSAASISMFITKVKAPAWVMGGGFGPEGGLAATIAFLAGIGILWLIGRNRKGQLDAGVA